jgi:predicted DsbA family dithiol-disulfide isomerase
MHKIVFAAALCCLSCVFAADESNPVPGASSPAPGAAIVAQVDGAKLTLADLERLRPNGLFQARNAFFEATRKVAQDAVDEYLLERKAKEEHVTVSELLERHVNSTIAKDPSEDALRVYYEGVDTTQPYEAVRGQILESLRQRRLAKAKAAFLESLRSESKIVINLGAPRADVSLKGTPILGDKNSPVLVVEFADYECPYCQQTQPALDKLEKEFTGKVAFAYKDTPLPMHTHAEKAAEAAHCAGAQGKYWEYHDLLFQSHKLEVPELKEQARELKLDSQAFDKCLDSGEEVDVVKAQLGDAVSLGIQGTPSFLINGRFLSGALPYDSLRAVIEQELSASTAQKETASRQQSQVKSN